MYCATKRKKATRQPDSQLVAEQQEAKSNLGGDFVP